MRGNNEVKHRGFTLVEVMIVVVIVGILAATVLPQFATPNGNAREAALVQDLVTLRSQIEMYRFQHKGRYPANGSTEPNDFIDAMLRSSDTAGMTGPIGSLPYGPYFIGQLPPNPYNGLRTVLVVNGETLPAATNTYGWIYNSDTGRIKADAIGKTAQGMALEEL